MTHNSNSLLTRSRSTQQEPALESSKASVAGELVLSGVESLFNAPTPYGAIDGLMAEHRRMQQRIVEVAALFGGDRANVVSYFIDGNRCTDGSRYSSLSAGRIFQVEGALRSLDAAYWQKALSMTDIYDAMPQARRDEWNKQIREMTTPQFTDDSVRSTLEDLLAKRMTFLAERVDGIFRVLSRAHVTNTPEGFGKRMIIAGVVESYGMVNTSRAGYLNDLRAVIAKFMGREEPDWYSTSSIVKACKQFPGQWFPVDGGALRMRVYKIGTAHLEVHPDMAWRLNATLAHLHPLAIPSQFREPPARREKTYRTIQRPLPNAVLALLSELRRAGGGYHFKGARSTDKHIVAEARRVLESIGAIFSDDECQFDYDPTEALAYITASGCVPDQQTHQYYPTPASVADAVIEAAAIGPEHLCLEPSAGTGALTERMPSERTTCVEISALHAQVLASKGFNTVCADFLTLDLASRFDRVCMNPPFSDGRAIAHVCHAATCVRPGGRLVAVMPASTAGKDLLPGFACTWSPPFHGAFAGTGVSVVVLTADRIA